MHDLRAIALIPMLALAACASRPVAEACPIPGEAIHWQADACLFESETDDIIAAQPCMDRGATLRFADACAEKRFYKQRLCEGMVAASLRAGTVAECVADPAFVGRTVRDGGV